MTCSLVIALPGLNLAAADTRARFTAPHWDAAVVHDEPSDLELRNRKALFHATLSGRQRKIRRIRGGWTTGYGDLLALDTALDLLAAVQRDPGLVVARKLVLRSRDTISFRTEALEADEPIDGSSGIMCAANGQCWAFRFDEAGRAEQPIVASGSIIHWPTGMGAYPSGAAQKGFEAELHDALHHGGGLPAVVRAAARVINTAALASPECGPIMQLGLTANRAEGVRSLYLCAPAYEVLGASGEAIERMLADASPAAAGG